MRTGKEVIAQVKEVLEKQYQTVFPEGVADNELPTICKRTAARKRVELINSAVDSLGLSMEEIEAWHKQHAEDFVQRSRDQFENYLELNDTQMCEYLINNNKNVWSLEERQEKAAKLGSYGINEHGEVDTIHRIKKASKKK